MNGRCNAFWVCLGAFAELQRKAKKNSAVQK
jgi:hypothetical protein